MRFSKFIRGIRIIFSKIYWNSEKKEFASCGRNSYIEYPFVVIGGKKIWIGDNVYGCKNLQLEAYTTYNGVSLEPKISIGNHVSIGYNTHIGAVNEILIEDNVMIASRVLITDHYHGKSDMESLKTPPYQRKLYSKGKVKICRNAWIGENVSIMPGVVIGENSIIGANSVVTHDIPANCVAAGIPAKPIKQY